MPAPQEDSFSAERKAKIAAKTAQLQKEMAEHKHLAEKLDSIFSQIGNIFSY